ncbi:hypothetical protein [Granulosicoccus antarcticus]|uniref:Uncharacterized protein n=1 Tax=Granulosicoccus antarcticus IMCC3135 TaxID=1192854 RepID=A0A2Z2P2T7_9GAMM|nr:hypothetical protein [Granulosicoccus antarcticus]ASJ76658.1 hypothetical protein IMCC3135_33070 [Granulosicoccus antarcticus IMCC3135]
MNFIECYLCGGLAVPEKETRDRTLTVFCTSKPCGRYDIEFAALQMLQTGVRLKQQMEEITARVYAANRRDERVLITTDDLQPLPSPTTTL